VCVCSNNPVLILEHDFYLIVGVVGVGVGVVGVGVGVVGVVDGVVDFNIRT